MSLDYQMLLSHQLFRKTVPLTKNNLSEVVSLVNIFSMEEGVGNVSCGQGGDYLAWQLANWTLTDLGEQPDDPHLRQSHPESLDEVSPNSTIVSVSPLYGTLVNHFHAASLDKINPHSLSILSTYSNLITQFHTERPDDSFIV
jgi:hypothetical protein